MLCVYLCISPRLLTDSGVVSGKPLPGHIKTGHGRVYSVLMAGSGVRCWCSRGPLLCFWIHLPRAAITKYYRLHGLTFIIIFFSIFSQFGRLEVWDQGVRRVGFLWDFSSWLVDGCLLPVFSYDLSSVYGSVLISSSYKDTSHSRLGFTLMTSFDLNYLFKGPIFKYWVLEFPHFSP